MKVYNNETEKMMLEQESKEIQKKEIEKKRKEREQQSKVKTWGSFKRRGLNLIERKGKCGSCTNSKVHLVRQSRRYIY